MASWKGIIGKNFSIDDFADYCSTIQWTTWRPSFIVLHNTYIPSLKDRPNGFDQGAIQNFVSYYRDEQGWSGGPHLFIDDHQIWAFTPLTVPGVHAPSWNQVSLGIEMLGNYDVEDFDSGRGALVQKNAVAALAILSSVLGLDPETLRLHKEDPLTTHKSCPGKNVVKSNVIQGINSFLQSIYPGEHKEDRLAV